MSSHHLKRKNLQLLSSFPPWWGFWLDCWRFFMTCVTRLGRLETNLAAKTPVAWWWLSWLLAPLGGLVSQWERLRSW